MTPDQLFSIFGTIVTTIPLIVFSFILLKASKTRVNNLNKWFFEELDCKIKLKLISNKEDIIILIDSFLRGKVARYDLKIVLEDYLRYLVLKSKNYTNKAKENEIVKQYNLILKILNDINTENPYSELSSDDQRIFTLIHSAIEEGDKKQWLTKLEELSRILISKNKIFKQSSLLNKMSIPLAILWLILTVFFWINTLPQKNIIENSEDRIERIEKKIDRIDRIEDV